MKGKYARKVSLLGVKLIFIRNFNLKVFDIVPKLARKVAGGLDAVIAMTGHKDIKLADHYSSCNEDDQKEVAQKIMKHIREQQIQETPENVISLFSGKAIVG